MIGRSALLLALSLVAASGVGCRALSPPSTDCGDGKLNGEETDLDCGGPRCAGCGDGKVCLGDHDCGSGVCTLNRCAAPTCADGVKNGSESDVDCGGPCAACVALAACTLPSDCAGGACVEGGCAPVSCGDGRRDGVETDVDCGGGVCPACGPAQACRKNADCAVGVCANGVCADRCAMPLLDCQGACVDPRVDPAHCGGCSGVCSGAEACVNGQCLSACGGGTVACGGACVDVASNPLHCGGCNQPCNPGVACVAGLCTSPCFGGQVLCGGACVSLERDARHCGGCDQPCAAGATCVQGQCLAGCPAPLLVCAASSTCVDAQHDPDNCNACGAACPPAPNASRACVAGACALGPCQPGFEDCNGTVSDGCEAALDADPANCGRCGRACAAGESCAFGVCGCPLPPGTYQATCTGCSACNGVLSCTCRDAAQTPRATSIPLGPCPGGYTNCNGVLLCAGC